jgi:hypothetical protein
MKRKRKRKFRTEAQKKQEARNKSSQALEQTKRKLGIGATQGRLRGAVRSPLVSEGFVRNPNAAPTSDRIPGAAPVKDLIHAHRWKRGAEESASTVAEIRRKATRIGPAFNKGALQYLPSAGVMSSKRRSPQ